MNIYKHLILVSLSLLWTGLLAQTGAMDFNGDGKKETYTIIEPPQNEEALDCFGECVCHIRFSDEKIPDLLVKNCIGGVPDILGDLDGNGTIEIGIYPYWWTSCWSGYHVYTLAGDKWVDFIEPITIYPCDDNYESHKPLIERVPQKKGFYKVKYYSMDDTDIQVKTKNVEPIFKK